MKKVIVKNRSRQATKPIYAGYCDTFLCRFRGLMFRKNLPPNWGLLLVQANDSRLDSAIHMIGMRFNLAIIWINSLGKVVDVQPAYRWRSIILPKTPAKFVLELSVEHLSEFKIGDEIRFEEVSSI